MSTREVISRHLFSWQTFWSSCSIWRQQWLSKAFHLALLNSHSAKMMLGLAGWQIADWPTSRAFWHCKCLILEPCAVFKCWFIFGWWEGWRHDWGFYQMKWMEFSKPHLSLFGRPRFKGSDAQSLQTKSCCFKERCCILFDIPLGIEYSAMSTECVPARNLLELVWPVLHDWQLLFRMSPKVDRNLPWLVWPVLHERRQSFSIWPKVGKARRVPHPANLHTPPCFDLVLPAKLHIPARPAYMQNYFSSL